MSSNKVEGMRPQGGFLGSLRDALAAAGRDDGQRNQPILDCGKIEEARSVPLMIAEDRPVAEPPAIAATVLIGRDGTAALAPSAAEAARTARGGTPNIPPIARTPVALDRRDDPVPTTRVLRRGSDVKPTEPDLSAARTQLIRGRPVVKRGEFERDPVVGWLVVVGGPGLGAFRPIFEGNNTVGRSASQRVPLDFGDDTISSEEQAYIRYDSAERCFLFVPNLAKTNIVSVNGKRPTGAVGLTGMDVIIMGRTQCVFVPFCGPEFDWSELPDAKT